VKPVNRSFGGGFFVSENDEKSAKEGMGSKGNPKTRVIGLKTPVYFS